MAAVQPAGRAPCQDPPEGRETSPKREGTCRTVTGVRKALLTSLVSRTLSGLGGDTIWVKPCAAQAAEANELQGDGSAPVSVMETRMLLQKVLEQGACQ